MEREKEAWNQRNKFFVPFIVKVTIRFQEGFSHPSVAIFSDQQTRR